MHGTTRRRNARVMSTIVVRCMRPAIAMIDVMVRMVVAVRVAALVAMMFGRVIVLGAVVAVMIAHMPAVPIAIAAAIIPIMAWIVIPRAAVIAVMAWIVVARATVVAIAVADAVIPILVPT